MEGYVCAGSGRGVRRGLWVKLGNWGGLTRDPLA